VAATGTTTPRIVVRRIVTTIGPTTATTTSGSASSAHRAARPRAFTEVRAARRWWPGRYPVPGFRTNTKEAGRPG